MNLDLNLLTLLDVHKAIQRVSPPVFHDFFTFVNHGKNTRGDGCSLIVPRIKTEVGKINGGKMKHLMNYLKK
jgi:hypothetical protein